MGGNGSRIYSDKVSGNRPLKYRNKKTVVDGIEFGSKHEAHRWIELKYMERAGLIKYLTRQVPYVLIDNQKDENGKIIERKCVYVADFVYDQDGTTVVEDAKGVRTDAYKIKRKLMLERYGIAIKEV